MKLSTKVLRDLAVMICGDKPAGTNFPYRSSSNLTDFFENCDLEYKHDGSTRRDWVKNVLVELNIIAASIPELPTSSLIRVIQELMDLSNFSSLDQQEMALEDLNKLLFRDRLEAYFDEERICHIRNTRANTTSAFMKIQPRPLSAAEITHRKDIHNFLEIATEDEFTEQLLVPLFRQLGFLRVSPTGHREKTLEFGKDLWMKFRLPTGHFIYFSAQVKKNKIDAAGKDLNQNISGILAQIRMSLDYPIFDPETNSKHLIDHVYIISANTITKQAKKLLGEHLDKEARRQIIFMDRDDLLDLAVITSIEIPKKHMFEDEIPF